MSTSSEPGSVQEKVSRSAEFNPLNWAFALVVAFALGLALGFFGRPNIIDDVPVQVVITVVPDRSSGTTAQTTGLPVEATGEANTSPSAVSMSRTNTDPDTSTAPAGEAAAVQPATPTIMEFVMSDARHMQGDVNAPVTIIEFSDFK